MRKQNIISRLVHKIAFLKNYSDNSTEDKIWEEVQTSFAEVKPICDNRFIFSEGLAFGNVVSEKYFLFKIRFTKDIDADMRISFKARNFEIKRIINQNERDKILNIIAIEI